ncbi:MAG: GAF domain-containing protein, partial [Anaerolineae bacterium]|nr:GAF domain-containing protein [Anaerolineae bacterium]
MNDSEKTKQQLIDDLSALRRQVAELKAAKSASRRRYDSDDLEQLRAIYYLGDMISQAQTVEAIYENALNAVRITLRAEAVGVALFSAEGRPYFNVWRGLSETFRELGARHLPWSPTEHQPSPLFIPDIKRAPITPQLRDIILDEGLRAIGIVPLTFQTKLIGHFILGYRHRHQFGEAEIWLVQTIAGHVTFAAERKRIENMLRKSQQQLEASLAGEREQRLVAETLSEVIVALTAQTSREAVLNEILKQVQRMISADETSILLLEAETYRVLRWRKNEWGGSDGLAETSTHPLSEFPYDKNLIHSRQSLIIPDPQVPLASDTPVFGAVQASLVIPICLGERVLGLLELESYTPHQFSTHDVERLQPLANAAAVALENVRLYEQVQRELAQRTVAEKKAFELNRKFLTIQYAGATLASSLNLQFVLETFTNEMTNLLAMQGCIISEWDETANTITVISKFGPDDWWPQRTIHQHRTLDDFPLMKWVLTERRSESLTLNQPDLNPSDRAYLQTNNINSLLILPMEFQDRIVGVIELVDKRIGRVYSAEEIALAQLLANQAAGAMENARLYEKAQVEIAERRDAERLFRQVATRKQSILDAIPDSLFFINSDGIILEYKIYRPDEILIEFFKNAAIGQSLSKTSLPSDLVTLLTKHIKLALKSRR